MSISPYTLEEVLQPRSVAILGASRAPQKWGHVAAKQLITGGFAGDIYLINPSVSEILDRPTYPTLRDVPGHVDLAIIATAYPHVQKSVEDCLAQGVKGIVIITAGFSETGPEGRVLEEQLVARCHEQGVRIIGSNCMGLYVHRSRLNALGMVFPLPVGPIGLVSQSGNLGMYWYAQAHLDLQNPISRSIEKQQSQPTTPTSTILAESNRSTNKTLGFNTFLSIGNAIDVTFPECMHYLSTDPETTVIAGYVEAVQEETLRQTTREMYLNGRYKPSVIFLSGSTPVGVRSALAHTGTQASVRPDNDTSLLGSGVIRVIRSDELYPVAQALAVQPPTPKGGKRIAIVGDGGGSSVATGDAAIRAGLEVNILCEGTQQELRTLMPARATPTNPIDVAGATDEDPLSFATITEVCLKDPDVDGVIVTGLFGGYRMLLAEEFGAREEEAARMLGQLVKNYKKPILVQTIYARYDITALQLLREENIPYYESVEITCRAMAALSEVGQFLENAQELQATTVSVE